MDREAALDERGTQALLRAAHQADPDDVALAMALVDAIGDSLTIREMRNLFLDSTGASESGRRCLAVTLSAHAGRDDEVALAVTDIERRFGSSPCVRVMRARLPVQPVHGRRSPATVRRDWQRAVAAAGTRAPLWTEYANRLAWAGDSTAADAALRAGLAHARDWKGRLVLLDALAELRRARGDSTGARTAAAQRDPFVRLDGRPGVRLWDLERKWSRATRGERDALFRAAVRLARSHHARLHLANLHLARCRLAADEADWIQAIAACRAAAAAADSVAWRGLRVDSRLRLGRVYTKAGRWRDGVAVLRAALALVDSDNVYYRAELHHNLAHAYESAGRLAEAMREVNQFAALAAGLHADDIGAISLYDAGVIRWKAGLRAPARAAFDSMVRIVDSRRKNFFYAGDYYERIGDLPRALRYYRRQPRHDTEEGARALAGLVRVYEALGMSDSAEAAARAHDREFQTPEEVPLTPRVLAAHGRAAEALALSRAWAMTQRAHGNVNGATMAELEVARLLLEQGRGAAAEALRELARADSIGRRATVAGAHVRTKWLAGQAELMLGRVDAARRRLAAAAAQARASGSADDVLETELALGDARRAAGRPAAALAAYDAAARAVDRLAGAFDSDLDRVRLRARQMAPFDHALELLLALPPSRARTELILGWSQRRKAGGDGRGGVDRPRLAGGAQVPAQSLGTAELQARLDADQALVDYVLLDSAAAAVVVTRAGAAVVPLPTRPALIARDVDALRGPLATAYMGQVDLAHAEVDSDAAGRLAAALLRPIAPFIAGTRRLLVVPDGPLHLLPFDMLPLSAGELVLDRYAVSLLPSASFVAPHGSAFALARAAPILFVSGDVPGGAEELRAVRQAWPNEPLTTIEAKRATATALRLMLPGFGLVHFATHAAVNARDPLSSELVLHGSAESAGTPDDELQIADIEKTRSRAQLVVLSACATEDGQLYRGSGPVGLARAFLVSGSRAVVATQWPVGASASAFMRVFYTRLGAGDSPEVALWRAKAALRGRPETRHPFHWAGFVLVGEAGAVRSEAARHLGN